MTEAKPKIRAKRAVMTNIGMTGRRSVVCLAVPVPPFSRAVMFCLFIAVTTQSGCTWLHPETAVPAPAVIAADKGMQSVKTNPLSIQDAVRLGILQSSGVALAKIADAQNSNAVLVSKSAYWPEIFATVSPSSTPGQMASANAGISYTLYSFGAREAHVQADEAVAIASDFEIIKKTDDSVVETLQAYINFAIVTEAVALARSNLAAIDKLGASVESRVNSGASSSADLNEVRAGILRAETTLLNAEAEKGSARIALMTLTGVGPQSVEPPQRLQSVLAMDAKSTASTPDFKTFPSAMALQQSLLAAKAQLSAAKAGRFPSIKLEASAGVDLANNGDAGPVATKYGPSISNVFSLGGGPKARVSSAILEITGAQARLAEEYRQLNSGYLQAQNEFAAAQGTEAKREAVVAEFEQMANIFSSEYESGSRSLADVVDMQSRVFQARNDALAAKQARMVSALSLRKARNELEGAAFRL